MRGAGSARAETAIQPVQRTQHGVPKVLRLQPLPFRFRRQPPCLPSPPPPARRQPPGRASAAAPAGRPPPPPSLRLCGAAWLSPPRLRRERTLSWPAGVRGGVCTAVRRRRTRRRQRCRCARSAHAVAPLLSQHWWHSQAVGPTDARVARWRSATCCAPFDQSINLSAGPAGRAVAAGQPVGAVLRLGQPDGWGE